jgi:3-methylcrotonyl-CoA carboxylase alpha subunit
MLLRYRLGNEVRAVRVVPRDGGFVVTVEDRSFDVAPVRSDGPSFHLRIDGRAVEAFVVPDADRRIVKIGEFDPVILLRPEARPSGGRPPSGQDGRLTAVMEGHVVSVLVQPGERVETGALVVVLEAMKMEMKVVAPFAGRVRAVSCAPGDVVERNRVLVEIDPEPSPEAGV